VVSAPWKLYLNVLRDPNLHDTPHELPFTDKSTSNFSSEKLCNEKMAGTVCLTRWSCDAIDHMTGYPERSRDLPKVVRRPEAAATPCNVFQAFLDNGYAQTPPEYHQHKPKRYYYLNSKWFRLQNFMSPTL